MRPSTTFMEKTLLQKCTQKQKPKTNAFENEKVLEHAHGNELLSDGTSWNCREITIGDHSFTARFQRLDDISGFNPEKTIRTLTYGTVICLNYTLAVTKGEIKKQKKVNRNIKETTTARQETKKQVRKVLSSCSGQHHGWETSQINTE